jgi:hypothetical protein
MKKKERKKLKEEQKKNTNTSPDLSRNEIDDKTVNIIPEFLKQNSKNNFITPTKQKVRVKNKEDISDEEYDLLSYDQTSSDEEILGESFNIPYKQDKKNKFIPGNKIHVELAAYENIYRKIFYNYDQGVSPKSKNGEKFSDYYGEIEKNILNKQKNIKDKKIKFKATKYETEGGRENLIKSKDIQKLKESEDYSKQKGEIINSLKESIGYPKILSVKKGEVQPHKVYPNFGLAKLSYLNKEGKLISKFLKSDSESGKGHSEAQIFKVAEAIIDKNKDIETSKIIILDIHTALSMCYIKNKFNNSPCHSQAEDFVKSHENIKIRVSYNFPYPPQWKSVKKGNDNNLFQKQIEIPSDKKSNEKLSPKFIFTSSGYKNSPQHKVSITKTNTALTPKKITKDDPIEKELTYGSKPKLDSKKDDNIIKKLFNNSSSNIFPQSKESIEKTNVERNIKSELTEDSNIMDILVNDFSGGLDLNKNDDVSSSGESSSDE